MSEKLVETPFLASDLVPPGSSESIDEIYSNKVIPVRTWKQGNLLTGEDDYFDESGQQVGLGGPYQTDEEYSELERYFAKILPPVEEQYTEVGDNENENEEGGGDDEDLEDFLDAEDDDPHPEPPSYGGKTDEDYDESAYEIEENDEWSSYKTTLQPQQEGVSVVAAPKSSSSSPRTHTNKLKSIAGSIHHQFVDLANEAAMSSIETLLSQAQAEGTRLSADQLNGIWSEYNQVMHTITSPRKSVYPPPEHQYSDEEFEDGVNDEEESFDNRSGRIEESAGSDAENSVNCINRSNVKNVGESEVFPEGIRRFLAFDSVASADDDDDDRHRSHRNEVVEEGSLSGVRKNSKKKVLLSQKQPSQRVVGAVKPALKRAPQTVAVVAAVQLPSQPNAVDSTLAASQKHKAFLYEIQSKRKREEERLARLVEVQAEKRRKFREALLEKAMKSRQLQDEEGGEMEHFRAKTKAFEMQEVQKTADSRVLTAAEQLRLEEERREQIAAIRRKFKEQHKRALMVLMEKKREEETKAAEQRLAEAEHREKLRKRAYKLAQKKELNELNAQEQALLHQLEEAKQEWQDQQDQQLFVDQSNRQKKADSLSKEPVAEEAVASTKARRPRSLVEKSRSNGNLRTDSQPAPEDDAGVVESPGRIARGETVAGSALVAVRSRSQESKKRAPRPASKKISAPIEEEPDADGDREVTEEEMQQRISRKLAAKKQQEKLSSYLATLQENKRKEMDDLKRKEERVKKRAQILSERVRLEAAERKAMNSEDKPRYLGAASTSNSSNNSNGNPKDKSSKVVTNEAVEAMINRLASKTKSEDSGSMNVQARDYADWKRKNSVPSEGMVFAMTGWYPCVKQALLDRGWYFNSDPTSPFFDLKWTLRSIDVEKDSLQPWQLTNHFLKNVAITTKVGLLKSLQSVTWLADVSMHDIIPRGYDLSVASETQAFLDDYRLLHVEGVLRRLYARLTGVDRYTPTDDEQDGVEIPPLPALVSSVGSISEIRINKAVWDACIAVLKRVAGPMDDSCLDEVESVGNDCGNDEEPEELPMVSPLEWELISNFDLEKAGKLSYSTTEIPIDGFLQEKVDENRLSGVAHRRRKRKQRVERSARDAAISAVQTLRPLTMKDLQQMHELLHTLHRSNPLQSALNGAAGTFHNMWIVKPAAKSRGRGIATFNDVNKLLKYVDAGAGSSSQWIVQKYMENPLIIAKRKFDMRQWVLVTDWNPLTIYFYNEFYARFSVDEYSCEDSQLENCYAHLVNNSIGKNSVNFTKSVEVEKCDVIEGYMWSMDSFKSFISQLAGADLVTSKIQPRMKDIARASLMCASEMIEHRKNSWELYGFDYMVDDEFNAWLIEINSSPACDYSTKVTERYVQKALVELLSVVLDQREYEANLRKKAVGTLPANIDLTKPELGGWECIYKGPLLETPVASFGTDMTIKGESMKSRRPLNNSFPVAPAIPGAVMAATTTGNASITATSLNNASGSTKQAVVNQSTVRISPPRNTKPTVTVLGVLAEQKQIPLSSEENPLIPSGASSPEQPRSLNSNSSKNEEVLVTDDNNIVEQQFVEMANRFDDSGDDASDGEDDGSGEEAEEVRKQRKDEKNQLLAEKRRQRAAEILSLQQQQQQQQQLLLEEQQKQQQQLLHQQRVPPTQGPSPTPFLGADQDACEIENKLGNRMGAAGSEALSVGGASLAANKSSKKGGGAAGPPTAPIPIKVFTVDFGL